MQKLKQAKTWRLITLAALILCMIPLLILAWYSHSSADDYSYGYLTRCAWEETHSLLHVFGAAGQKISSVYQTWQGSYAAVAFFALQPAIFGEQFYPLGSYFIFGIFIFANFYFFRRLICQSWKGTPAAADLVSCVALLLCTQLLPSPVEGFFWWNGASYYVLFYALLLIQLAVLLAIAADKGKKGGWKRISVSVLLGVLIAGGNYISALLLLELTALLVLYALWSGKNWKGLLPSLIGTGAGFLVNCLAPGNSVRQAAFENWSPVRAILYSYHEAYGFMVEWTKPLLFLGLLFLLPFLWQIPVKLPEKKRIPFWALIFVGFSLFASSFTPTLYAYGDIGAGRIQNIRYFLWIVLCIVMECGGIFYMKAVWREGRQEENVTCRPGEIYERYALSFYAVLLICVVFCVGNHAVGDEEENLTSITAFSSLLSGEAAEFDAQARERIRLLGGEEKVVELPAYTVHPYLLYWSDIEPDGGAWTNQVVAQFYGKDEVRLKDDTNDTEDKNR